jgi:hypothetical protein
VSPGGPLTAVARVRTSAPLTARQLRALHGTARELNPAAEVTPAEVTPAEVTTAEVTTGFRLRVTRAGGTAAAARAESYRILMYLVCHAGLDVVDARAEVEQPI